MMLKLDLPMYDPLANCPKCGADYAKTNYCTGEFSSSRSPCRERLGEEHLDRRCERCGFLWLEAVLQAEGSSPGALQATLDYAAKFAEARAGNFAASLRCRNCGCDVVPEGT